LPEGERTPDLIAEILECSLVSLARKALLLPQNVPASPVENELLP
jgi:hypothetical protein